MNSPFAEVSHRIFLCYGAVRDNVLPPGGIPLPFDAFLHRHLRTLGYATIVYYSHRGLYFYDRASRNHVIDGAASGQPAPAIAPPARRTSPLAAAPGGLSLRRRAAPAAASPMPLPPDVPMCYPNLNRLTEMLPTLRRLTAPDQPDVAVIFDSDHLSDFSATGASVEQFRGFLDKELRGLPVTSRTILIFLFGMELEQLTEQLRRKPALDLLLNLNTAQQPHGLAIPIHLGAPERDEVQRLIHFYRLLHALRVDWPALEHTVLKLTAALKTGALGATTLRELESRLHRLATQRQPLDAAALRAMTGHSLAAQSALQRLDAMIGLESVKTLVHSQLKKWQHLRHAAPKTQMQPASALRRLTAPPVQLQQQNFLHLVLEGNPGTGKTTVAQLIGEIYQEAGLLELGHTVKVGKADLVGGYVGQTALKTSERIEAALGGVLFIDEAYSLVNGGDNDFGQEAITTLIDAMSSFQERLCVIFAGYPKDMERLIAANAGFPRRVTRVALDDYTPPQLATIFDRLCQNAVPPVECDAELSALLPRFFQELYDQRPADFGNASTVATLFQALQTAVINELAAPAPLHVFSPRHIPPHYQSYLTHIAANPQEPLAELDALIGLTGVKRWIHEHLETISFEQQRGQQSVIHADHYLFLGNPGTGKTTVARLMAEQFKQMGLLKTARLTEVTASQLSGQPYLGQTEQIVRDTVMKALGGVLFIDEAHQLAQPHGYGHNVLNTLTPLLTNHAAELSVIFAGYPEQMQAIFAHDPGLKRRFKTIVFDDFSADELAAVFSHFAHEAGFTCAPEVTPALAHLFDWMLAHRTPGFGNAGTAQQVFERTRRHLARRVRVHPDSATVDLNLFEAVDIPLPETCGDLL